MTKEMEDNKGGWQKKRENEDDGEEGDKEGTQFCIITIN